MKAQIISTLVAFAVAFFAGILIQSKYLTKDCICNAPIIPPCPQPLVKIQSLDVDKLKSIKGGFYFSPSYTGNFVLCDSIKNQKPF